MTPAILFIAGLLCLIKGGDWFVDGRQALRVVSICRNWSPHYLSGKGTWGAVPGQYDWSKFV